MRMMISIPTLFKVVAWRRKMEKYIQDCRITRAELSTLLWGITSDISTHSLSMWLKSKTNDEFVVVPRYFILEYIEFLETERNLNSLKVYL